MKPTPFRWAAGLAAFGALERVCFWLVYGPVSFGDTPSYLRLANILGDHGLTGYDASRVPGYPLFLLALGGDERRVWLAQMALGWGISLLLFWIGWRTMSARAGFVLGLLYDLIPGLVLFEANLLSETLTAFCVVAGLAVVIVELAVGLRQPGGPAGSGRPVEDPAADRQQGSGFVRPGAATGATSRRYAALVLGGILAGLAGLVRALFYPLAPWLALFVGWNRSGRLRRLVLFAAVPALMLGGWVGWVFDHYEMLSPTTMGGYHLVQHTGEFFELLPDEQALIRDTYLKYRDPRIAARGSQTNTIWDAIPELSEVTGLSFFGLSAELQRLSVELILTHPGRYLVNAARGWIDFWKAPAMWEPAALQVAGLEGVFNAWALGGRAFSLATNAGFLALSAVAAAAWALARWEAGSGGPKYRGPAGEHRAGRGTSVSGRRAGLAARGRRALDRLGIDLVFACSAGLIWLTSIVQTLVDHGDNPRFLVPLQMVVIFVVLRSGRQWWQGRPRGTNP